MPLHLFPQQPCKGAVVRFPNLADEDTGAKEAMQLVQGCKLV